MSLLNCDGACRANFSAAAGFGFNDNGKVGIFSTFAAFLEMSVSEVTMARLNRCNVICHYSHSGVDEMSDNTCEILTLEQSSER